MKTQSTRPRGRAADRVRVKRTPSGGKIARCGPFNFMDRAALDHHSETDPTCRPWRLADELCDKRLAHARSYPRAIPYNRPGYPDGDPSLWTPQAAMERHGCHLVH